MDSVATKPRLITGHELGMALINVGFIGKDDGIRRLIIDAEVTGPVRIYVERVGDERVLALADILRGAKLLEAQTAEKLP